VGDRSRHCGSFVPGTLADADDLNERSAHDRVVKAVSSRLKPVAGSERHLDWMAQLGLHFRDFVVNHVPVWVPEYEQIDVTHWAKP
jgi:hypothetical protein